MIPGDPRPGAQHELVKKLRDKLLAEQLGCAFDNELHRIDLRLKSLGHQLSTTRRICSERAARITELEADHAKEASPTPPLVDLHNSTDASEWARAFCMENGNGLSSGIDEELMLAWFSNALMAGRDWQAREGIFTARELKAALRAWWDSTPDG